MTTTTTPSGSARLRWVSWLWQGTANARTEQRLLLFLSASMAAVMFLALQPSWNSDSEGYVHIGRVLLGTDRPRIDAYFRTPGFPVLLNLTGVTTGKTFARLFLMHAIMGALIPVLIYWTMFEIDRRLAFWCGLAAIFSLVPYLFAKDVMSEQSYLFFQFVALCCLARFLYCGSLVYLYAMGLAIVLLPLIRPSANALSLLFLGTCFLKARGKRWHVACCALLVAGCMLAWSYERSRLFGPRIPFGGLTNASGVAAFAAIEYPSSTLSSMRAHGSLGGAIQPENGPATEQMLALVRDHVGQKALDAMIQAPKRDDYVTYWIALDLAIGPIPADELLRQVTFEALLARPYLVAVYWRNFLEFMVGFPPASTYLEGEHGSMALFPHIPFDYRCCGYRTVAEKLPPRLQAELDRDYLQGGLAQARDEFADKYYGLCYTVAKSLVLLVILVTLPFLWRSPHRLFVAFCLAVVLYQAAISSVFAMAVFRYHVPVMLLEVMVALCGVRLATSAAPRAPIEPAVPAT